MYFKLPSFKFLCKDCQDTYDSPMYKSFYYEIEKIYNSLGPFKVPFHPLSFIDVKYLEDCCYIGEFDEKGRLHGFGLVYQYYHARLSEAFWHHGNRSGTGRTIYKDSTYYIGEYKDDKWHGFGTWFKKDGTIIKSGKWKKDKLV